MKQNLPMKTQSVLLMLALLISSSLNFSYANDPKRTKSTPGLEAKKLSVKIKKDQGLKTLQGNEGAMTAEASGGTPPYRYKWSTGSTEPFVNGLRAGRYSVSITDAAGTSTFMEAEMGQLDCTNAQCQFRTQTQGGWGTNPHGNNPGVYLNANFSIAFPNGLQVGCTNTLSLTSAQAVRDFLPSGTTPRALPAGNLTNPGNTYKNVLAGQVVALTLSVGFDLADPNFATPSTHLANLVIASGTFAGMTVQQVLNEANRVLGGCSSNYSASQMNDVISSINENYVDGTTDQGFLLCQPVVLQVTAQSTAESCYQLCDGTAFVQVSGGTAPYTFSWSNGATGSAISGLCPGSYDVNVMDAMGCTGMATVSVGSGGQLSVSANGTDISCFGADDGTAIAQVSGGTAPYSYAWSNGASTANISGLEPGTYTVIVMDANYCTGQASVTLLEPRLLAAATGSIDASCLAADGSLSAVAQGGTAPYSYLWSPGGATTANVNNITAGVYSVLITDAHGCTASAEAIVQGNGLNLGVVSITPVSCPGEDDGSATVMASGGTAPYSYSWSPYGGTGATATNLVAGTYIVRVEDYNGCPSFIIVEVGVLNPSCNQARFGRSTNITNNAMTIYPNPVRDQLIVNSYSADLEKTRIEIVDMTGRIVFATSKNVCGNYQEQINLSHIPDGIYLLKVQNSSGSEVIRFNKH